MFISANRRDMNRLGKQWTPDGFSLLCLNRSISFPVKYDQGELSYKRSKMFFREELFLCPFSNICANFIPWSPNVSNQFMSRCHVTRSLEDCTSDKYTPKSMALCKITVTPLLTHWRYFNLAIRRCSDGDAKAPTSKMSEIPALCNENLVVTDGFPSKRASNAGLWSFLRC